MTYATDHLGDEPVVTERDIPIGDILEDAVRTHGPARMFELCYWASEPGFFEMMRAIYAVPEGSREALQSFLAAPPRPGDFVTIADAQGRLTLDRRAMLAAARPDLRAAN